MKSKIFISHSSIWKGNYVNPLVEILGRDAVIVDKYNFESGEPIWNEINKAISQCQYFLLLISKEALRPDGWVEREINRVRELVDAKKVVFWPIIIDPQVEWNDPGIKHWIRNEYITDKVLLPKQAAHLVRAKIRRDRIDKDPSYRQRISFFIGRDSELSSLQAQMLDRHLGDDPTITNTIIIHGFRFLGRKRFLKEFLVQKVKSNNVHTDIAAIRLDSNDDEWSFAQQINELIGKYTPDQITKMYGVTPSARNLLDELLLILLDQKLTFIIEDNGAIVRRDGHIVDWFITLIKSHKYSTTTIFNIVSRFTPRSDISLIFPSVLTMKLEELTPVWSERLIKEYARFQGVDITDASANEAVRRTKGYPRPMLAFVDSISSGISRRKFTKSLTGAMALLEENFKQVVDDIKAENAAALDTLKVLAHAPMLSESDIQEIIGDSYDAHLDLLDAFGILSYSGKDNEMVSLNSGVADFVRRRLKKIGPDIEKKLRSFTVESINNISNADLGGYLMAKRQQISDNRDNISTEDLIPALVLKLITELYYQNDNDGVISMADQLLKSHAQMGREAERAVRYWLCSALCRKADKRLLDEVRHFKDTSYSHKFLLGFYHRHNDKKVGRERAFTLARDFYQEAYAMSRANDSEFDDAKLLHEMWIVKFVLGDTDYLSFAEKCYTRRPGNQFHIEAYFRSLVRSKSPDWTLLNRLISELQSINGRHSEIICLTLKAEMEYFRTSDFQKLYADISSILDSGVDTSFRNYPLRIFRDCCQRIDSNESFRSLAGKHPDVENIDTDFLPD